MSNWKHWQHSWRGTRKEWSWKPCWHDLPWAKLEITGVVRQHMQCDTVLDWVSTKGTSAHYQMFNYFHLPGFGSIDHTIADQLLWLSMEFPLIKTHRTDQVGTASVMARWTPLSGAWTECRGRRRHSHSWHIDQTFTLRLATEQLQSIKFTNCTLTGPH